MSLQRSWSASLLKISSFQSACLLFEAESMNYSIIPWRATIPATLNSSNAPAELLFISNTEIQSRTPLPDNLRKMLSLCKITWNMSGHKKLISWLHCTQTENTQSRSFKLLFQCLQNYPLPLPKKEAIQNTKPFLASHPANKKKQDIQHLIINLQLRLCSLTASTLYTFSISRTVQGETFSASYSDNVKRCPLYCVKSKGKYAVIILQNKLGASKILQVETKYSPLPELALSSGL